MKSVERWLMVIETIQSTLFWQSFKIEVRREGISASVIGWGQPSGRKQRRAESNYGKKCHGQKGRKEPPEEERNITIRQGQS